MDRRRRVHAGHGTFTICGGAIKQGTHQRPAGDASTALDAQPKQRFDHRP